MSINAILIIKNKTTTPSGLSTQPDDKKLLAEFDSSQPKDSATSSDKMLQAAGAAAQAQQQQQQFNFEDMKAIQLTRQELAKWLYAPFFADAVRGCFVRVNAGMHPERGGPVYRVSSGSGKGKR